MKKLIVLVALCLVSLADYAQQKDCGLPTCDLPGDPGIPFTEFALVQPGNGKQYYLQAGPFAGNTVWIDVKDKAGRIVMQRTLDVSAGSALAILNCIDFQPGRYAVIVHSKLPVRTFWIVL